MRSEIGRIGELTASNFLVEKGYRLVERNYRTKYGEIDLVMKDGGVWVFVEVKTKSGSQYGRPEEMFGRTKYAKVVRMGTLYMGNKNEQCRVDMVAVDLDVARQVIDIRHYENVFY